MYAVIETGGKQYRVQEGDSIVVEKLQNAVGEKVEFDKVLVMGEGADIKVDLFSIRAVSCESRLNKRLQDLPPAMGEIGRAHV